MTDAKRKDTTIRRATTTHIERHCGRCGQVINRYNTAAGRPERKGVQFCGKCYLIAKKEERKRKGLA